MHESSHWLSTAEGSALHAAECDWLHAQLQRLPGAAWAWLSPRHAGPEWSGDWTGDAGRLRGTAAALPPWPIASNSMGRVILQHVADEHPAGTALLGEVVRVLEDGGRVWLLALHARAAVRPAWQGAAASTPLAWRMRLRAAGLEPLGRARPLGEAHAGGLGWALPLSFGLARYPTFVIEAEKRRRPLTPRLQRAAPALDLRGAAGA